MRKTRLRILLDTVFKCKNLAIILPLLTAFVFMILGYLLCDSFGANQNNLFLVPLFMLITFAFVSLLLFGLMHLKYCPGWYIDTIELLILLGTGVSAITQIITFFIDNSTFSFSLCICVTCWSAVSLAHNSRNIYKE